MDSSREPPTGPSGARPGFVPRLLAGGGPRDEGGPLRADPEGMLHVADLELARRAASGDRDAGDELVALHLHGVYRFVLYRVGRDVQAAEDLAQDTLLTAIGRLEAYDGRASLEAWLRGIARNLARSGARRRRPARIEDILAASDADIDAVLARIEHEPLPDEVLERAETAELVGATLSSLPSSYREALLEKYVEERSVPETARRSGRNVKAVESTLHRARRAFAEVFTMLARRRGEAE